LSKCLLSIQSIRGEEEIEVMKGVEEGSHQVIVIVKYLFKTVGDRNSEERIRIIKRWNMEFEREKDDERRKREAAEAKINFILIQQRIQENMNQKKNEKAENRTSK
jgi:hypothetical protein